MRVSVSFKTAVLRSAQMSIMSSPDINAAQRFLSANARVLEWQRFERLFGGGGDPDAPGEIHTPLDFAPRPGSLARGLFDKPVIEAHLDHLAAAQQADGGWTFNWLAWSPAAEREWRGVMTVNALHLLRANGRC
jgi:hypothetical protein